MILQPAYLSLVNFKSRLCKLCCRTPLTPDSFQNHQKAILQKLHIFKKLLQNLRHFHWIFTSGTPRICPELVTLRHPPALWPPKHLAKTARKPESSDSSVQFKAVKARSVTLEVCLLQDLRDEEVWTCTRVPAANVTQQLMFLHPQLEVHVSDHQKSCQDAVPLLALFTWCLAATNLLAWHGYLRREI